jgi:hypothetical protein
MAGEVQNAAIQRSSLPNSPVSLVVAVSEVVAEVDVSVSDVVPVVEVEGVKVAGRKDDWRSLASMSELYRNPFGNLLVSLVVTVNEVVTEVDERVQLVVSDVEEVGVKEVALVDVI